jgi:murein DD-endopeptidase MepM/ murein hydrolase activator NlpD
MRRLVACSLWLALAACGGMRAEKIQFAELYPPAPDAPADGPDLAVAKAAQAKDRPALSKVRSKKLRAALKAFVTRARNHRIGSEGQPFSAQALKNWLGVLDAVELFLKAGETPTSSQDARLARAALDLELELDVRTYVGFPSTLAQNGSERIAELAYLASQGVRPSATGGSIDEGQFSWPVQPVAITSLFGRRLHPILGQFRLHFGVDLKAYAGQPIAAASAGRVVRAGWNGGHGQQVEILHPGGAVTRYSHLSKILVSMGSEVRQGDVLGSAGDTGQATGVHLHFEFWRQGRACDPLEELRQKAAAPRVAHR